MPQMGAVIHHGGTSTLAQALVSGTPQLALAAGGDRVLLRRGNGYVVEVAVDDYDVLRFEEGVASGGRALAAGEAARAGD